VRLLARARGGQIDIVDRVPRRVLRPDVSGLLDAQVGLVRRDQVVGVALTDAALAWLLRTRRWRVVLPSVYATSSGALTETQRLVAAQLYGGEDSLITGPAALRAYGLRSAPSDPRVHLLLPHRRHLTSVGSVVVIRTRRTEAHPVEREAFRLASVARAVADTARAGHDQRLVRAFVTEAVQRGLASVEGLWAEVEAGQRHGRGVLRAVVGEVRAGVRSAPEAEFKDLVEATSEIPEVRFNPVLHGPSGERLPTPDAWIEDAAIAVEIDSREYHATAEGWARTLARHNVMAGYGVLILHFTPAEIRSAPEEVRRRLVQAYRSRLRDGAHPVIQVSPMLF
jgi:hypothetical protein